MFGLDKYGAGIGLHRIQKFCRLHAIDIERFSKISIVVTGSKGKGSTASLIYSILSGTLGDVACFTSPHLISVTERYEFVGHAISHSKFETYRQLVFEFAEKLKKEGDALGEFELLFLVALKWFTECQPRAVVWEAGIGGRYDPVRTLRAPLSVL